ncbi:MAG: hypothetical protein RL410_1578 [Actinomycetota bacterium]
MTVVFVTGEIGAGKSTLCSLLEELGAEVISADDVVSDVYENQPDVLSRIEHVLGKNVRMPNGSLDRATMANVIFSSPSLRAEVEAIVHPKVREVLQARLGASTASVTVYDVPIVREREPLADVVVNVIAPVEVRLARLMSRGMSEHDARMRMEAQAGDDSRLRDFDVVIENSGDKTALRADAVRLMEMVA